MHQDCHDDCKIEELALIEENLADYGDFLKEIRHEMLIECEFETIGEGDVAADLQTSELTCELCDSGSECGHRKTGDVLVGSQGYRDEREDDARDCSDCEGCDYRQQDSNERICVSFTHGAFVEVGGDQSEDSAHIHDTFDTEVQVSGFLGQDFSDGSEHQGRAVCTGSCEKKYEGIEDVHAFTSFSVFFLNTTL